MRQFQQVMAKLGQNEFPEIPLAETVDLARRIYDDLGGEVRRDGLAIVLDMSPTGGAFGARISALRMWGLATGRGLITLTQDAILIASNPTPSDENRVIRKLAASVPLFNELHQKIGDANVDQSVMAVMLQEITGAEMSDVTRRVAMVERIFGGIRAHLDSETELDAGQSVELQSSSDGDQTPQLPSGWIEFRYDDGSLRMRETVENLDMLIGTLETRRNRLIGEDFRDSL